jgi:hypothetical protein
MNGFRVKYSSLAVATLLGAGLAAGQSRAEPTPQPSAAPAASSVSPVTTSALSDAATVTTRPTFASIPARPTDIRAFQAWRGAIADIKAVGAQTAAEGHAGPWILADTEGWADHERAEAAPPKPMTTPAQGDTDAFVREMLRRATPPPRAH